MYEETLKVMKTFKFTVNDAMIEQTKSMLKPATYTLVYIWTNVLMGLIVGLVMAAFIKKEKSIFVE